MTTLESQLNAKPDIGLDSMDSVALMDRFDDKYLIPYAWLPDVIDALPKFRVLRINDGCMTRYNNLYFDTQDDRCFADHVRGKNKRFKVRIRHYTNTDVAFLEVKLRDVYGKTTKHRVSRNGQDAWNAPLTKEETRFLESGHNGPWAGICFASKGPLDQPHSQLGGGGAKATSCQPPRAIASVVSSPKATSGPTRSFHSHVEVCAWSFVHEP